jgi:hypothetical protein
MKTEWACVVAFYQCNALNLFDCGKKSFTASMDLSKRECPVVLHDRGARLGWKKSSEAKGWTSSLMWLAQPSWSAQAGSVERYSDRTLRSHLHQHSPFIIQSLMENSRGPCSEIEH